MLGCRARTDLAAARRKAGLREGASFLFTANHLATFADKLLRRRFVGLGKCFDFFC